MVSMELMERIREHEGFSRTPYMDSTGHITVGYGRNLEDKGITKSEAEYMLINDINNAIDQMLNHLSYVVEDLNDGRKEVIVEMIFNMGIYNVLKFRKMIAALQEHNYLKASREMLDSKWAKQVGQRALDLAKIMRG